MEITSILDFEVIKIPRSMYHNFTMIIPLNAKGQTMKHVTTECFFHHMVPKLILNNNIK